MTAYNDYTDPLDRLKKVRAAASDQTDDFVKTIKLEIPYTDLLAAAEAICVNLPKLGSVTEWLRSYSED